MSKEAMKKYFNSTPEARLYVSSFASSKKRGLEHNITVRDIREVMPDKCPYLGVEFTNITGLGKGPRSKHNRSIDRIDSSKGYVKGNIQIVSILANKMLQDASTEELLTFSRNILKMYENVSTEVVG